MSAVRCRCHTPPRVFLHTLFQEQTGPYSTYTDCYQLALPFIIASIFACSPLATRGQAVHLDADPKGENILYTNGKSVYIRNLEVRGSP